ncbi:hypothetical protein O181_123088 [Austropuccinia psidii MF-1]|uniref:Uncharacterized protein n=1 Tax=Austropuccinia psidii MF-1 TaxID=1389203 RepID=A0A9Q3KL25_9BASI|nr:hypothetical protein [Austropuccinia psidii MF-1]
MELSRTSTSFQRLVRTFETLFTSPEADITAIPIVRHEPFPTGNNRGILVSVQEMVYGSKAEGVRTSSKSLDRHHELISSSEESHGPRKVRGPSEGLDTHFLKRTSPTDQSLVEKPKHFIRGIWPKERTTALWKLPKPPQARICLNKCQQKEKKSAKSKKKGKQKAKGKEKSKWNRPYPQNYRIPKKEKTAMDNVFNMARTLMEFKNKEEERMNQSFCKK